MIYVQVEVQVVLPSGPGPIIGVYIPRFNGHRDDRVEVQFHVSISFIFYFNSASIFELGVLRDSCAKCLLCSNLDILDCLLNWSPQADVLAKCHHFCICYLTCSRFTYKCYTMSTGSKAIEYPTGTSTCVFYKYFVLLFMST